MSREAFCWEGSPTRISYLGQYARALVPLASLGLVAVFRWFAGDFLRDVSGVASFVLREIWPDMPTLDALIYAGGVFLSLLLGLLVWVVALDIWVLVFEVFAYLAVEAVRVNLGIGLGLAGRVLFLALFSFAWMLLVDAQRKTYRYSVSHRGVAMSGGLLRRVERYVSGDAISDVIVVKPLLGRLFGFGHVVVVTPSQLGLGETYSLGGGATSRKGLGTIVGGGRAVREVLAKPWNCIFGVKNPDRVRDYILNGC
ncbi:MAG: PH domain-containing protein [Thermofilum sp.]|uniref:PH domain-containing protein n=1 Tax=Thermofilum sp. TaxID=1961369 RepID=UPI003169F226